MRLMDSLRAYTIADPLYFERVEHRLPADDLLDLLRTRLGSGVVDVSGIWARCLPRPMAQLPAHGWKLHVSARPAEVAEVVSAVIDEYAQGPFNWKCVRDSNVATAQLARWWPRGGAGKAVTVYPTSPGDALALAERLARRLARFDGPYILTDRRYRDSRVVHYRYGSFRNGGRLDPDGRRSTVVTGPDGVPWDDAREPRFALPPWPVENPFPPVDAVAGDGGDLLRRYTITGVLRHTTAGGVYAATGPDGTKLVVKEARPHTAIAPDGSDAVERLHREHAYLLKLAGSGVGPAVRELGQVWEHTFLVQERVPGITLQLWLGRNQPIAQGHTDAATFAAYRDRVTHLLAQLRAALSTCLDHGVVYNDVSLSNIMVDEDDTLRLIDFESCRDVGADPALHQRTAGFAPEPGSPAWADDDEWPRYAVAAVEAACLAPRNALFAIDKPAAGRAIRDAGALVGWPTGDLLVRLDRGAPGVADDRPDETVDPGDPAGVAAAVARHIRASATPDRPDRLFPADPEGFRANTLCLAYGAAGVLRSLKLLDGEVDETHLAWLRARLDGGVPLPPGLWVGTAGIGLALLSLGDPDRGHALLAGAARQAITDPDLPADVATGRAGIGLALLAAAASDPSYLDSAGAVADRLCRDAQDDGLGLWWEPWGGGARPVGYLYGSSGVAGFLCALAGRTGSAGLLRTARAALDHDLAIGAPRASGGLGFHAHVGAVAYEPYYSRGGAGVGMAATALLAATGDERLRATLVDVVRGVATPITVQPGLFTGTTSVGEFLLDARAVLGPYDFLDEMLGKLVTTLCTMGRRTPAGVAFPGSGLVRYSCDVATGSAGVGLFLHRLAHGTRTLDVRYGDPEVGDA